MNSQVSSVHDKLKFIYINNGCKILKSKTYIDISPHTEIKWLYSAYWGLLKIKQYTKVRILIHRK